MVLRRDGSGAANRRPTIGSADGDDDGSEWDLADVPVEASETSEEFGETSERLRNAGTGTVTGAGSGERRGSGGERVESLRERYARRARAGLEGAAAVLPPPPSAPEDVEHWTRAMYVDARR